MFELFDSLHFPQYPGAHFIPPTLPRVLFLSPAKLEIKLNNNSTIKYLLAFCHSRSLVLALISICRGVMRIKLLCKLISLEIAFERQTKSLSKDFNRVEAFKEVHRLHHQVFIDYQHYISSPFIGHWLAFSFFSDSHRTSSSTPLLVDIIKKSSLNSPQKP